MLSAHWLAQHLKRQPRLVFICSDMHAGMASLDPGARAYKGLVSRLSGACKIDDAGNIIVKYVLQTFDLTILNLIFIFNYLIYTKSFAVKP
jgi:hypothetical protein